MATMTRDEALTFLAEGTRTGKLATASPDGAPHVAPIWFVPDGDTLVFMTGADTVKGRHLLANPRAALTADVEAFPYHFVTVRGRVSVTEDPDLLLKWSLRIAGRYVPTDRVEDYGRRNAVPGELLCRLSVDRILGLSDVAH